MNWFSISVALLVAVAIITVGLLYICLPRTASRSFGLPLPEEGANIAWWLRLKGLRDIVSGLVLFAITMWSEPNVVGVILLIQALIPLGDMTLILAGKGSAPRALGIHGATAALMILAAVPLIVGAA